MFTMDGGTISDGTGTRGAGVLVGLPGGVYNESTAARFVMNDGTISGNTANATTATVNAGGGGVFVQDNAEFSYERRHHHRKPCGRQTAWAAAL